MSEHAALRDLLPVLHRLIMKAHELMPQIAGKRFSDIDVYKAFKALVVGYFLKMFVADNLAQFTVVLPFRHQWQNLGSEEILALMLAYSAQIYATSPAIR